MKKLILAAAVAMALIPSVGFTQDFDKGLAAAQSGDFAAALKEWLPLAEQGNAAAQRNLGMMYYGGDGVLQDYLEAEHWYRLSAEQGDVDAQHKLGMMYPLGAAPVSTL